MEKFLGLSRDTARSKTPTAMWEFARNIIISKELDNIINEPGTDMLFTLDTYLGSITTNEHIVVFSIDSDANSIIDLYKIESNHNGEFLTRETKLKTNLLGFKENRPIEGIFFYNQKRELIVSWCDGIFDDSNTPKIMNITNPGFAIDPTTKDFIDPNDITKLELISANQEATVKASYQEQGSLDLDVLYVTYSYVDNNNQTSRYAPIVTMAYPKTGQRQNKLRNVVVTLTNLDPSYNKLKIVIIGKKDNATFAYETNIRTYGGTSYNETITSSTTLNPTSVESVIVPSLVYTRVNTMTTVNNQVAIGNLKSAPAIPFQKYANLLKLGLQYDHRDKQYHNEPILCPDEVYSFTVSLQLKGTGEYTEEFHIPGPVPNSITETDLVTLADLEELGIDEYVSPFPLKRFHLFNTGKFVTPTNETVPPLNITVFPELPTQATSNMLWGYWENAELYPDNGNYDSTVDYNGNAIVDGVDLTGTPVRYHRVPGLDAIADRCGINLGETPYGKITQTTISGGFVVTDTLYATPSFSVNILNFDAVVPDEIKSQIQGYRLSIVKRNLTESIVKDISYIMPGKTFEAKTVTGLYDVFGVNTFPVQDTDVGATQMRVVDHTRAFALSRVLSNNLLVNTPSIPSGIVKANYAISFKESANISLTSATLTSEKIDTTSNFEKGNVTLTCVKIPATGREGNQKYATLKKIQYLPPNNAAAYNLFMEESVKLVCNNTLAPPPYTHDDHEYVGASAEVAVWNPLQQDPVLGYTDLPTYDGKVYELLPYTTPQDVQTFLLSTTILVPVENLYFGLQPTEFITLGRIAVKDSYTDLTNGNIIQNGGDVFLNNLTNVFYGMLGWRGYAGSPGFTPEAGLWFFRQLVVYGGISNGTNNSEVYWSDVREISHQYSANNATDYNNLEAIDYTKFIYNNGSFISLNDLIAGIAFSHLTPFINAFPYRVHRSLTIPNENLNIANARTFLANDYYEMPNDRGDIVALRASNKFLYIQQRYSLFLASVKDKITTVDGETYLGQGDLFDRTPDEILSANNKGYIGCSSKWASRMYRDGYTVVDQDKGHIFLVSGTQAVNISDLHMRNYFKTNSKTSPYYSVVDGTKLSCDNPASQVGHLIGYDNKYNRLLFTKKYFRFLHVVDNVNYSFDGEYYYEILSEDLLNKLDYYDTSEFVEESVTLSFDLDSNSWISEHDYFPSGYIELRDRLYSVTRFNDTGVPIYTLERHNNESKRGFFYGERFPSYIDLMFNTSADSLGREVKNDIPKRYIDIQIINKVNDTYTLNEYFSTVNKFAVYNDYQSSGLVDISTTSISSARNAEGIWRINNFRDTLLNKNTPVVDSKGNLAPCNNNASWFNKSLFISTFIVVRLHMDNTSDKPVCITNVNVKSVKSNR